MKKIDFILSGKKLIDKLFNLRKKKIERILDAAKDNLEKQKCEAELEYEELLGKLGDENADYENILNSMIKKRELIENANATLEVVCSIESDLNSEVEESE